MWLALIIAVLTYLLSPRDTSTDRKQALLKAAGAGAITYGISEYTDWGKENLKPLDNKISGVFSPDVKTDANGNPIKDPNAAKVTTGSTGSGVWDAVKSWGPTVVGTVGAAAVASSIPSWVMWAALAAGAYLLLKD